MKKYINIRTVDNDGGIYRISVPVQVDKVRETIQTMLNQLCLVIDSWGYGDYSDTYDRIIPLVDNLPIDDGFSGIVEGIKVGVTTTPRFSTKGEYFEDDDDEPYAGHDYDVYPESGNNMSWLENLLQGQDYDPDTDPFDMSKVLPTMGPDKLEFDD